ncbi:hypothetical protein ES703_10202 [subsurface metagenome]
MKARRLEVSLAHGRLFEFFQRRLARSDVAIVLGVGNYKVSSWHIFIKAQIHCIGLLGCCWQ